MTRINSAIDVKCLTDEHLLAEHREIKRLPYCLEKAIESGSINNIPNKFTLGKGHVTFFLNKQRFVVLRYWEIYRECIRRNLNVKLYNQNWLNLPQNILFENFRDYKPTLEERQLLIERITERIMKSHKKVWHYYGKPIGKEEAIELLKNV